MIGVREEETEREREKYADVCVSMNIGHFIPGSKRVSYKMKRGCHKDTDLAEIGHTDQISEYLNIKYHKWIAAH